MKPVIAFCGAAGAGKDSVAKRLESKGVVRYGFARPLKALCARLFSWDEAQLDELAYKEAPSNHGEVLFTPNAVRNICTEQFGAGPPAVDDEVVAHLYSIFHAIHPDWTRRRILQWVGTEGFRALDPNHWTAKAFEDVRALLDRPEVAGVALTDLRFLNEGEELRKAFPGTAFVIRVERIDGPQGTTSSSHQSEQEFGGIPADYVFRARFGELPLLYEMMESAWTEIVETIE